MYTQAAPSKSAPPVGTCCLYFTAPRFPTPEGTPGNILYLDGEGSGIVNNMCVPSEVSPSYAPPGRALISTSTVGERLVSKPVELYQRFINADLYFNTDLNFNTCLAWAGGQCAQLILCGQLQCTPKDIASLLMVLSNFFACCCICVLWLRRATKIFKLAQAAAVIAEEKLR